ncbi:MAG: hypothetical protein ACTSWT_11510 [Candidatus Heimdallarchaeota archaeon]
MNANFITANCILIIALKGLIDLTILEASFVVLALGEILSLLWLKRASQLQMTQ